MRSRSTHLINSRHSVAKRIANRSPVRRRRQRWQLVIIGLVLVLTIHQLLSWFQRPDVVLVLGGAPEREIFAASFARQHPDLPIWVSSGSPPEYSEWVFSEAGIQPDRLHLDYRAEDTVTNFTTLVDDFRAQGVDSIYLITSDYHMRRAKIIGEIVLGSRGIDFKPIEVPSEQIPEVPETLDKTIRDGLRSLLWVMTGRTGSTIGHFLSNRQQ